MLLCGPFGLLFLYFYASMIFVPKPADSVAVNHYAERILWLHEQSEERPYWVQYLLGVTDEEQTANFLEAAYLVLGEENLDDEAAIRLSAALMALDHPERTPPWLERADKEFWAKPFRNTLEALRDEQSLDPADAAMVYSLLYAGRTWLADWTFRQLAPSIEPPFGVDQYPSPPSSEAMQAWIDRITVMVVIGIALSLVSVLLILVLWRWRSAPPLTPYQRLAGKWPARTVLMSFLLFEGVAFLFLLTVWYVIIPAWLEFQGLVWILDPLSPILGTSGFYHHPEVIDWIDTLSDFVHRFFVPLAMCMVLVIRPRFWVRTFGLELSRLRRAYIWFWVAAGWALSESLGYGFGWLMESLGEINVSDIISHNVMVGGGTQFLSDLLIIVIAAPIVEEVVFRGFIYSTIREKAGVWIGAFAGSLIFAVLHYYSWIGVVYIFFAGLVYTMLYQKSGSLWPPIVVHMLGNLLITLNIWSVYGPFPGE